MPVYRCKKCGSPDECPFHPEPFQLWLKVSEIDDDGILCRECSGYNDEIGLLDYAELLHEE